MPRGYLPYYEKMKINHMQVAVIVKFSDLAEKNAGERELSQHLQALPVNFSQSLSFRLSRLISLQGECEYDFFYRAYPGRGESEYFGGDKDPFCATSGRGKAWFDLQENTVLALKLDNQSINVIEDNLLAFQGGLKWKNGKLATAGQQLNMVNLKGSGIVYLNARCIRSIILNPEKNVLLRAKSLVAWQDGILPYYDEFLNNNVPEHDMHLLRIDGQGFVLTSI